MHLENIDSLEWDSIKNNSKFTVYEKNFDSEKFLKVFKYRDYFKLIEEVNGNCRVFVPLNEKLLIKYYYLFKEEISVGSCLEQVYNNFAIDYAKYIVTYCNSELHKPISNITLQRILFDLQKSYFKQNKSFLFQDDFEAWVAGPCIPKVYYFFCGFGAMPIVERYNDIPQRILKNEKAIELMHTIAESFCELPAWQYTFPDSWKLVYTSGEPKNTIDRNLIEWEAENSENT